MDRKKQKLNPGKIGESNNDSLDINSLPNEMILKIFGYLEQNQLGQIARVCLRWNVLTMSPDLWKKVDVKFHWSHKSHNTVTRCFVNMLPSCVTSIRLCYSSLDCTEKLNFEELCVSLQRCPHFEMLILEHVHLSDNLPSVIGFCTQFLPGLKILIFRHSTFSNSPTGGEFDGISKIEILDISDCNLSQFCEIQFSKMPQLRVLNLRNTYIGSRAFQSLRNHGLNLEELYLCGRVLYKDELKFNKSMFPQLKIICLHNLLSTRKSIAFIMESCQSLQKVYISDYFVKENFNLFFKHNRCKLNIIETIAEHHSHNVDYSYKINKI